MGKAVIGKAVKAKSLRDPVKLRVALFRACLELIMRMEGYGDFPRDLSKATEDETDLALLLMERLYDNAPDAKKLLLLNK